MDTTGWVSEIVDDNDDDSPPGGWALHSDMRLCQYEVP
jgi:hypothetical protein